MGLIARNNDQAEFPLTPAGTYLAICYLVADIGLQPNPYNEDKPRHRFVVGWELPNELMSDGRPFGVIQTYTLSLGANANLRKDLEAWRGRAFTPEELEGFEMINVLGKPCTLTIVHNAEGERTYANMASIGGVMKGMAVPAPSNKLIYFDKDEFDNEIYEHLPKWIKTKIDNAIEPGSVAKAEVRGVVDPDFNDALPAMDLETDVPF